MVGSKDASDAVSSASFKAAMRRLAGAVTIIATDHHGELRGLTATATCSLSADPPLLLACVARAAEAHDLIAASGRFSVNLLRREQEALARAFAGLDGRRGADRFAFGSWACLRTGAPVLVDSLASFDCRLERAVAIATHSIFVGLVVDAQAGRDAAPLLYVDRRFTGLGTDDGPD